MSGILFLRTAHLAPIVAFYTNRLGCTVWLDQTDCVILRHDNFLFGFCERDSVQADVMLTFFYESRTDVDRIYASLRDIAEAPPRDNDRYRIYQFFARDPEGRIVECQHFAHRVTRYRTADNLLRTRRSVRDFSPEPVPDSTIREIIDSCRFAPTAYNNQPQYYRIIRDSDDLRFLGAVRDTASAPIGRAPAAVAVCIDTTQTAHAAVDGAIAVYHFLLAAWDHGLGTCWMGSMDMPEIKARLGLPPEHYIATVTPLGYPRAGSGAGEIEPPVRRPLDDFLR